jgi:hypothetical protein
MSRALVYVVAADLNAQKVAETSKTDNAKKTTAFNRIQMLCISLNLILTGVLLWSNGTNKCEMLFSHKQNTDRIFLYSSEFRRSQRLGETQQHKKNTCWPWATKHELTCTEA